MHTDILDKNKKIMGEKGIYFSYFVKQFQLWTSTKWGLRPLLNIQTVYKSQKQKKKGVNHKNAFHFFMYITRKSFMADATNQE